jgi:RNA polymerase sigma-70 factor (ECF subfamily)
MESGDHLIYRPGVREDFERLYRDSYRRILYTLVGVLGDQGSAEDCAQETFVRAYKAWNRWQPDAPAEAWLHRIALNVAISQRRRERFRGVAEVLRRGGPTSEKHDGPEEGVALADALRRLPPRDAALIVLRHHHGYTNRQIAAALGVPESTVSSRLSSAKRRLRAVLGDSEISFEQIR